MNHAPACGYWLHLDPDECGCAESWKTAMTELERAAVEDFIHRIRNRTCNTIEQWNLMLEAERKLEQIHGGWEPPLG